MRHTAEHSHWLTINRRTMVVTHQRLGGMSEAADAMWNSCACRPCKVLFLTHLKMVKFKNGVLGVLSYGVLNYGHGCRRHIWPLLGSVPGRWCKKTPQNQSDDPSTMLMNTGFNHIGLCGWPDNQNINACYIQHTHGGCEGSKQSAQGTASASGATTRPSISGLPQSTQYPGPLKSGQHSAPLLAFPTPVHLQNDTCRNSKCFHDKTTFGQEKCSSPF